MTDWTEMRKKLEQPIEKYSDKKWVMHYIFYYSFSLAFGLFFIMFMLDCLLATSIIEALRYFFISLVLFVATAVEFYALIELVNVKKYYRKNTLGRWVETDGKG